MVEKSSLLSKELASIVELIGRSQKSNLNLGRTQLMKLLYLMQSVKHVPLTYRFTLYTYGPFDPEVLEDLGYAESLGAIKSRLEFHPKGYQYSLAPAEAADKVRQSAQQFVEQHSGAFDWAVKEFGRRTASDLETITTLVYVDQLAAEKNEKLSQDAIVKKVLEIKPHVARRKAEAEAQKLRENGLIRAH
jgi:hypothetical protein